MILEDQIIFSHIFRFLCEFVVVGNPEWREIVHYFKTFLRGNKLDIDISRMMDNINDILTINSIYNLPERTLKSFQFNLHSPYGDCSRPF